MATSDGRADGIEAADDLYDLDPSEFTAARNALAKHLKADGDRDAASEVAALRRPTVVAWALNQVARHQPELVAAAVAAADAVAGAQRDLLEGGEAGALRSATAAQRTASTAVVRAAAERTGGANADAITTTLEAALADPDLRGRLRAGTLAETLDAPAGFGFGFGADLEGAPSTGRETHARRRRPAGPAQEEGRTTGRAKADTTPKGAKGAKGGKGPTTDVTPLAVARARREVDRLARQLADAEEALGAAETAHRAAGEELDDAASALDAARRRVEQSTAARAEAAASEARAREARDDLARKLDEAREATDEGARR